MTRRTYIQSDRVRLHGDFRGRIGCQYVRLMVLPFTYWFWSFLVIYSDHGAPLSALRDWGLGIGDWGLGIGDWGEDVEVLHPDARCWGAMIIC